jgi:AraC family transcriptional regulator of arabinose operon
MERREDTFRWVGKLVTGYFRSGPGYDCWRSRGTPDWLLTYTYAGLGRYGHAVGEVICQPGELVLLRPGTLHDYGVEPKKQYWEFVWAHFHPRTEWLEWLAWPEEAPGLMRLSLAKSEYRARVARRFRDANDLARSSASRREDLAMNALEEVLLWCDAANPQHDAPPDPRVRAAMEHCCRNLGDRVTLGGLAKVCGLSPSRLSYLFQTQLGQSPMRWLEHQRIARARDLLEVTVEPVQAIAEQVGFSDPFYFSSRFRRSVGMSPRSWRRTAQKRRGGEVHD